MCGGEDNESQVVGDGECGINGNTKIFQAGEYLLSWHDHADTTTKPGAPWWCVGTMSSSFSNIIISRQTTHKKLSDQSATTCSLNPELGGDIEGPYISGPFELPTFTQLVGDDNSLLYQVFVPSFTGGEDALLQSQLTTITKNPADGQVYRTRTAQGFDAFVNVGMSTYASYYRERKVTRDEFYAALESATVEYNVRDEDLCIWDNNGNNIPGAVGSLETCEAHLEESFALGGE